MGVILVRGEFNQKKPEIDNFGPTGMLAFSGSPSNTIQSAANCDWTLITEYCPLKKSLPHFLSSLPLFFVYMHFFWLPLY